eukprot:CAMPEP_0184714980 /NCGR_PEP_ID=MMETSP0314-20130426/4995_1 /TAXON_ID=38298 /ORGANISM="Rhodella maculata, Strain CCMP 736" /LENGTH=171 /DNA_ID=CAMNT_0027178009 /DNA_START=437 /DNA_END=949 /DNA_ORIENTATION=+
MIRPRPHVHHHRKQPVQRVVLAVVAADAARVAVRGPAPLLVVETGAGADGPDFEGEDHAVVELFVALDFFDEFEALEVQREDRRRVFDPHLALGFLQSAARVAIKLVVAIHQLHRRQALKTRGQARILRDVHRQVQEALGPLRHGLAPQAPHQIRKLPLEQLVHERPPPLS